MIITMKVKICGITNLEDAQAAFEMGADMLGFNFYPQSPRYIRPEDAIAIVRKLPTFIDTVGLFVNASLEQIHAVSESGYFNWIQLHGDETPEFCSRVRFSNIRTIKAIRVKTQDDVQRAKDYNTQAVLLDAYSSTRYGGTGQRFDWAWVKNLTTRLFIAGGITPENVAEAIHLNVYGLDICSGIESEPGKKDHPKMRQLFNTIRQEIGLKARV